MPAAPPVIVVMLRQPTRELTESRTDPMYEFGCFGLTGCHSANLLRDEFASGARLAFAQGGSGEVRLVYVTPPVRVVDHGELRACSWTPAAMPLRFKDAPLLINNDADSDVDGIRDLVREAARSTWVARFTSKFRSRKKHLEQPEARALIAAWDARTAQLGNRRRAQHYWEALPYAPPRKDTDRQATYERLLRDASGELFDPVPPRGRDCAPPASASKQRARSPGKSGC